MKGIDGTPCCWGANAAKQFIACSGALSGARRSQITEKPEADGKTALRYPLPDSESLSKKKRQKRKWCDVSLQNCLSGHVPGRTTGCCSKTKAGQRSSSACMAQASQGICARSPGRSHCPTDQEHNAIFKRKHSEIKIPKGLWIVKISLEKMLKNKNVIENFF